MPIDDEFLDDLFLGCSFKAFVELAATWKGTPDAEVTRLRAYELYEEALVEKNRRR